MALLVGGDSTTGITVANPIQDVLNALPDPSNQALPTFVGGATHAVSACTSGGPNLTAGEFPRLAAADVQRAMAAKSAHADDLMADPAVLGVAVGAGESAKGAAITVLIQRGKSHAAIPATLDGVPVRLQSVGVLRAFGAASCSAGDAQRDCLRKMRHPSCREACCSERLLLLLNHDRKRSWRDGQWFGRHSLADTAL